MHRTARWSRLVLCVALWLAGPAAAQARDFAGTVVAISANRLTVQNRMGDRRAFAGNARTPVSGKVDAWGRIKKGDRVVVSWSLDDRPVRARHVRVTGSR